MALMSYKCPNCGGGLVFDPDSQKFQCEYCLSEFTEEEMKQMEEASASPAEEEEAVPEEEGTAPQEGDSSQSPETRGSGRLHLSQLRGPDRHGRHHGGFLLLLLP